jgi:serine/threonine protein kinase
MPLESSPDPTELAARNLGRVLCDKWRLERVIGAGGMATVYAATHRNNLRTVAIKVLHPQLALDVDLRKRFLREGYIANKVGHPGAVAVLDDGIDESDGSVFLIMDLLVGESLHERQRRSLSALEAHEVLRIVDSILDVLVAAHEQGIVHRDLKPDNVFLTREGAVKVLDFGIARLVEPRGGEEATRTGVMIGTPSYMPPEQARGRSNLVDARSDLWAVGAMTFALLTGRHVHEAETQNELLLRAMTTPADPLASVLPQVNAKVAAVVDRALAFDPADRWPDARTMQAAVREAIIDVDREGPPPSLRGTVPAPLPGPSGTTGSPGAMPAAMRVSPATGRSLASSVRTATPVIRSVRPPRHGLRVAVVVTAIGALAAGGVLASRWLVAPVRTAADVRASDAATFSIASRPDGSDERALTTGAPLDPGFAPGAAAMASDAAAVDAGYDGDADLDDGGDDDGGDEEDDEDDVDAAAPVPGAPAAASARAGHPRHPVTAPHKKHKRRHTRR